MTWTPRAPDVARFLDRTYAFELDDAAWLGALCEAFAESTPGAWFPNAMLLRVDAGGLAPLAVYPRELLHVQGAVAAATEPEFARKVTAPGPVSFGGALLNAGEVGGFPHAIEAGVVPQMPVDAFCISALNPDSLASLVVCLSERGGPLPIPLRHAWERIAAHVAAAARLRVHGLPRPTLVVDGAKGKVLDARDDLEQRALRDDVLTAAKAVDRVRGRRVTDPEEALRAWAVLAARRYTIADDTDSDGKRFVVVYENEPAPKLALPGFTKRERQVACSAALGHSNKHIAYELNVSVSAVSTHLSNAMKKLRVRSRAQLVRAIHERALQGLA